MQEEKIQRFVHGNEQKLLRNFRTGLKLCCTHLKELLKGKMGE